MTISWIEALKIWNADKPNWSIPKKGSAGYNEVRMIMAGSVGGEGLKQMGTGIFKSVDSVYSMVFNDPNMRNYLRKQREQGGGNFDIIELLKHPTVEVFVKQAQPIFEKIASLKMGNLPIDLKKTRIQKELVKMNKIASMKKFNKKPIVGKGQEGGFLATIAGIVAPFVIEGIINTAQGKPFFGGGQGSSRVSLVGDNDGIGDELVNATSAPARQDTPRKAPKNKKKQKKNSPAMAVAMAIGQREGASSAPARQDTPRKAPAKKKGKKGKKKSPASQIANDIMTEQMTETKPPASLERRFATTNRGGVRTNPRNMRGYDLDF
jgi:hypothetical protein